MADRFYGVPLGGTLPVNVTEGAATGGAGAPIELRVSDTVWANKIQVLAALEAVKDYLQTKETSPIA
jgi:hypothetical protein